MGTPGQKTRELVALAKDGDESALGQLCRVYGPRVRWIVRLRMGKELRSKLDSMDLVQDTLIYALKDLGDFAYKNEGDFLRWLSGIAENRMRDNLDKLHAGRRDIRKERPLGIPSSTTGGGSVQTPGLAVNTTPSAILARSEEIERLERAIDELKPEHREVIVLTRIEELSYQEVSSRLGRSPEAVRKLLCRAMSALARSYEGI